MGSRSNRWRGVKASHRPTTRVYHATTRAEILHPLYQEIVHHHATLSKR